MRKSAIYLGTTLKDTLDSRQSSFNHDRLFDSQWKLQRLVSKPRIQWLLATDVYKAFCQKESCVFCHLQPKSNLLNKQLKAALCMLQVQYITEIRQQTFVTKKQGFFPSRPCTIHTVHSFLVFVTLAVLCGLPTSSV